MKKIEKYKFYLLLLIIPSISLVISIKQAIYNYDGYHWGLILFSAEGLNLGGNEIYPSLFQPFGGFPDSSLVENSNVTFPKYIGMGYEKKDKLNNLFKKLFN